MGSEGYIWNNSLNLPDGQYRSVDQSQEHQSGIVLNNRELENQRQHKHYHIQQVTYKADLTEEVHVLSSLYQLPEAARIPIKDGIQGDDIQQTPQDNDLLWCYLEDVTNKERNDKDYQCIEDSDRAIKTDARTK